MRCRECNTEDPDRFGSKSNWCKSCYNAYKQNIRDNWTPEQLKAFKARVNLRRTKRRLSKFGLELPDYHQLLKLREYKCDICKSDMRTTPRGPQIDHDHLTNKFRGILCVFCNLMLGGSRDNTETLASAIRYLKNSP